MEGSIITLVLLTVFVNFNVVLDVLESLSDSILGVEAVSVVSYIIETISSIVVVALSIRLLQTIELFHILFEFRMSFNLGRDLVRVQSASF